MSVSLAKYATPEYMGKMDDMYSRDKSAGTFVYVEDEEDILFWKDILERYDGFYKPFHISVYSEDGKDKKGKAKLVQDIKNETLNLHERLLVCIDADYDLLIPNYQEFSDIICTNDFIIHTFWYAIENVKCHPANLEKYFEQVTLCSHQNFVNEIEKISDLYAPFFLWLIWCIKHEDSSYSVHKFANELKHLKFNESGITDESKEVVQRMLKQVNKKIILVGSDIKSIEDELLSKGFNHKNYYKLFQGHGFQDHVAVPMLVAFAKVMYNQKISKIQNDGSLSEQEKNDKIAHYKKVTGTQTLTLKDRIELLMNDCSSVSDVEWNNEINKQINKIIDIVAKKNAALITSVVVPPASQQEDTSPASQLEATAEDVPACQTAERDVHYGDGTIQ